MAGGGIAALRKRTTAGPRRVKIGLPKGANPYPDGTSVILVGIWNEFGTRANPERSFLRAAMREHRQKYRRIVKRLLARVTSGTLSAQAALELLGTEAAADVRTMVVAVSEPPNAPETIARKGSSNPLIDTGHMRQSITHQVVPAR